MILPLSKSANTTAPRWFPADGVTSTKPSLALVAEPVPPVLCQLALPYKVSKPEALGFELKLKEAVAPGQANANKRIPPLMSRDEDRGFRGGLLTKGIS